MGIVKRSKSGKQVQFVDDEGNLFVTSTAHLLAFMQGWSRGPFILLSRMPLKVSKDRFKQSPVWNPNGELIEAKEVDLNDDGFSKKANKEKVAKERYKDRKVW